MQITYEVRGFVDFTFRRWGRKVFHVHAYCSSPAKALQTSARRGSVTPTHIPTGEKDKCRYSQFEEAHTTEKKRPSLAFLGQHMWASRSTKDQPLVIQCYLKRQTAAWLCCHGLLPFVSTSDSEPKRIQTNEEWEKTKETLVELPGRADAGVCLCVPGIVIC